jgi:hypothetical protein
MPWWQSESKPHSATILAVMLEMPMNKGIHANNESVRAKLLSFSLVAAA